jgi:Uma2 family endonuclease
MTPILYDWPGRRRKRQLAPDIFVALAPDRPRASFDAAAEGFPQFILEVVSPSSFERDTDEKTIAYDQLGAREYALFTPRVDQPATLAGYRRDDAGRFAPWPTDERGRLWSEVLGLYLVAQGPTLRAMTPAGVLLPTLGEEAAARHEVELENERLRREIDRLRQQAHPE